MTFGGGYDQPEETAEQRRQRIAAQQDRIEQIRERVSDDTLELTQRYGRQRAFGRT